ncbi:MBL fold metallo-hydrolase [Azoarcus sp. PA01]|nr:MBL fold metallo-hydrolase [Azoarcus sp. PA01]
MEYEVWITDERKMRVCVHRGTRQIGGSCVEIEHEGSRIALDFGLPLDGQPTDAALVPRITNELSAVVISHPHIDHYGLLHHLRAHTPVCMGAAARRIIKAAAPFTGQPLPALDGPELEHLKSLAIGRGCVKTPLMA